MKKLVRKPYASILSRHDLGDGRMKYIVASSNGIDTYAVISVNFIVEKCSCPDHQYRNHDCKHMCGVQWYEEDRRIEVERAKAEEQAKAEMAAKMAAYDVVAEASKVAANAEAELDAAMYEVAAKTKNVEMPSCWACGRPGYYECPKCRGRYA